MNKFLCLIIIICIIKVSPQYNYETITELAPENFIFETLDFSSFKIYKYIPSDDLYENIYLQVYIKSLDYLSFYLYDNFTNIEQNENAEFINYKKSETFYLTSSILLTDLFNGKEYYFVFAKTSKDFSISLFYAQVCFIKGETDTITLSPDLSDHFSIYQRNEKGEKFNYFYNEQKYVLIHFDNKAKIKITQNEQVIYENETSLFTQVFDFRKNINYEIIFNSSYSISPINFQFFNEQKFFKYDFNNNHMILYGYKYNFEIDISDYEVGEYIVLCFYTKQKNYNFWYQFKRDFNGNNFINLGVYDSMNYIPIKKTKEDSSLMLSIDIHDTKIFSMMSLLQYNVEEIKKEFISMITGPKFYIIDYFTLNNIYSIGIESEESFYFFEQEISYQTKIIKKEYFNLFITKQNNLEPHILKRAFIFINSTNETYFEVTNYDFSVFYPKIGENQPESQYFQLCQGEYSNNELYFYIFIDEQYNNMDDLFSPVFGEFNSYFIKENEIGSIDDLDFDNLRESNYYNFDRVNGYLKINCTSQTMVKYSKISYIGNKNGLISGQKYYLNDEQIKKSKKFGFDKSLVKNYIQIKFNIYGLNPEQSIKLVFNNETFEINNEPLEISDFFYKEYSKEVFYFENTQDIEHLLMAEVIVGFSPEELETTFKQIDFVNSFGTLTIEKKKGLLIKIPKEFTEDLCDFSIFLLSTSNSKFDIQIGYDKLELQVPKNESIYPISPIIELFKVDPYLEISLNKFFYILIYNLNEDAKEIVIKKPKLLNDIELNKINFLPQMSEEENKKYYYQIKTPDDDYNSLLVQTIKTNNVIKIAISKDNVNYPFTADYNLYKQYFNVPINNHEYYSYINYYDIDSAPGYINLAKLDEPYYPSPYKIITLDPKAEQIEGENKIKIKMNSLSYVFYPNIVNYYLIVNCNVENDMNLLYSVIANNQTELDISKFQFMEIIEDGGQNEVLEFEIEIKFELEDNNYKNDIFFIPIRKDSNTLELSYFSKTDFKLLNSSKKKISTKAIVLICIFGVIIIIFIILVIYFKLCKD